jgi:nitrite reductase (NAD(P)H)
LLGLEAAKAMTDLEDFGKVKLIDRNKWVLARQLDGDAGTLVTRKIRELGLDVLHEKRVAKIKTDDDNNVTGIIFEDGEEVACCCICFAIGVRPRDELGPPAGIQCAGRGGFVINERSVHIVLSDIYRELTRYSILVYKLPFPISMPLANVLVGRIRRSELSHLGLKWPMCFPST